MRFVIGAFDAAIVVARPIVFGAIGIVAALCALDWAVRTRRLNPFGRVARFARRTIDPLMTPVERRIVRMGGMPASAPWWTLAAAAVLGFGALALLAFLRDVFVDIHYSVGAGPRGLLLLTVSWAFTLMQVAIIVRVITSWIGGSYSAIGRLAFRMTEWMLRPLRRVVPLIGGIDITPIIAWFLLNIVEGVVLGVIR